MGRPFRLEAGKRAKGTPKSSAVVEGSKDPSESMGCAEVRSGRPLGMPCPSRPFTAVGPGTDAGTERPNSLTPGEISEGLPASESPPDPLSPLLSAPQLSLSLCPPTPSVNPKDNPLINPLRLISGMPEPASQEPSL